MSPWSSCAATAPGLGLVAYAVETEVGLALEAELVFRVRLIRRIAICARQTPSIRRIHLARGIHTMQGKHVLGEIDSQSDNGHGLPLSNELMRFRTSHRGTSLPVAAMRLVRDGEVPFIR
jgi:hypothetical protein